MSNLSNYRQIIKSVSIFGGAQLFQIIVGIIRSKFIAVLLGPAGMGISGLLQATTGLISGLTNFGLSTSAVKNIAAAHATENKEELYLVTSVFRRLVWFTGVFGTLITLILSPFLSQVTFGHKNYSWAFAVLSVTLLFNQISAGQGVLLRGMRQIKYMAQSSMLGSLFGLLTSIPLYYFYGIQGIVPAIIIASFTALVLSWYFTSKLSVIKIAISWKDTFKEGKEMLFMGFMISLSGIITMAFSYAVRIFISNYGSVDDVGLYNAGFAIINTYVGMVFTAMSTDYFPRLSAVASETELSNRVVNQQAEIALLVLAPILLVFIVFIKWVIYLLYSTIFLPIQDMVIYAALGMLFKTLSWSIGYIFLAQSSAKLFFWNELITNTYMLLLNLVGYYFYGFWGLGMSILITYSLHFVQVYFVAYRFFQYRVSRGLVRIFLTQLLMASVCLFVVLFLAKIPAYIFGSLLIMGSITYSLFHLNQRINFIAYFNRT